MKTKTVGVLLGTSLLTACGGGGGGDGTPPSSGGDDTINTAPVAVAGATMEVTRAAVFSLDGSGSSDAEVDPLSYTWTQTLGPDVTNGAGFLTGVSPSITAPLDVSTLRFELVVNDTKVDSVPDTVLLHVMEQAGEAIFVDGTPGVGSDTTGDGRRSTPYASVSQALASVLPTSGYDIYVKTASVDYDERAATLNIPDGTSLYGGYGDNWVRDVTNNRTTLLGHKVAVHFENIMTDPAWFSGFNLTAADSDGTLPFYSSGVSVDDGISSLYVQDNTIVSGNTDDSDSRNDSYGLRLAGISSVSVLRNTISAGNAGNSTNAGSTSVTRINGRNGQHAGPLIYQAGKGGCEDFTINGCPSIHNSGGPGGEGGNRGGGNGENGKIGWVSTGGASGSQSGGSGGEGGYGGSSTRTGRDGSPGWGGAGRRGGNGGLGAGFISNGFYRNTTAQNGQNGSHGVGGGGGGGGEGGGLVGVGDFGAGGGGGGQGGIGGTGGGAGGSGGASIGILLSGVFAAVIDRNTISSGHGGAGAAGGFGGVGGSGGNGGFGGGVNDKGAAGGDGGGGGMGGGGGQGGAGAGGPSYAIFVGSNIAPVISNNSLTTGTGGAPGADGAGSGGGAIGGRNGQSGTNRMGGTIPRSTRGGTGTPAEGGWAYNIYDITPGDGLVPALTGNTFNAGTAGTRGSAGEKNFP